MWTTINCYALKCKVEENLIIRGWELSEELETSKDTIHRALHKLKKYTGALKRVSHVFLID